MFKSWFLHLFLSCLKQKVGSSACSFHVLNRKLILLPCFFHVLSRELIPSSCYFYILNRKLILPPTPGQTHVQKATFNSRYTPSERHTDDTETLDYPSMLHLLKLLVKQFPFQFCIGNICLSYFISFFIWTLLCLDLVLEHQQSFCFWFLLGT